MTESADGRSSGPPEEREWSPPSGPAWLIERERSLLDRDEEQKPSASQRPGLATRLAVIVVLIGVALLKVPVVLALKALF